MYKLSSIAMFVVVTFGYFYTVIPVYQKEKLAEDLAQIKKEIKSYEKTISSQKIKLIKLNEEKLEISQNIEEIHQQKEIAESKKSGQASRQHWEIATVVPPSQ